MKIALREARRGIGATSPNPRVGAVLVKGDKILAKGFHHTFGAPHAEVECFSKVDDDATEGATLYVSLEPCCHEGKTPPCTWAIKKTGVERVVYGMVDPNPKVNGKGIEELREAGIEVDGPVMENEAVEINRGYFKYIRTGQPWVTIKFAQSLDGRIAAATGHSRWISGEESLKLAHQLRAEHDGNLVGINTALQDDPQLTVRLVKGHNPYRIIIDPNLKLKPDAKVFDAEPKPVYIATQPYPSPERADKLSDRGAEFIWLPPGENGALDLGQLLDELGRRGIHYLLVEGGGGVLSRFIQNQLFDEMVVVTAPLLIGGDGIPSVASLDIQKVSESRKLEIFKRKVYGDDVAIWYRPKG